jgi:hypothetical protein
MLIQCLLLLVLVLWVAPVHCFQHQCKGLCCLVPQSKSHKINAQGTSLYLRHRQSRLEIDRSITKLWVTPRRPSSPSLYRNSFSATNVLMAMNVIAFALGKLDRRWQIWTTLHQQSVFNEYPLLRIGYVLSLFGHADVMHLMSNMMSLHSIAPLVCLAPTYCVSY